jgi:hypothetical protein
MSDTYFSKFPTIIYNDKECIDISRRCKLVSTYLRTPVNYYNYEIQEEQKAPGVAYSLYDDPYYDWMIYLSNDIVDPYYDWIMNNDQFEKYIENLFGSQENAIKETQFYRNNWYNDQNELTVDYYNNVLPNKLKKYYSPVFGINVDIISYKRKEIDLTINTNRVMSSSINYSSGNSYTKGEIIEFKNNGEIFGRAEVVSSNSTNIIFQHIDTTLYPNNSQIIGERSNSVSTIVFSKVIVDNIPSDEVVFWERVSKYDYEMEQNYEKRFIKVVNQGSILDLSETIKTKLNE